MAQDFINLHLVNRSIRELYRTLTPVRIRTYADNFILGHSWDDTLGDNFVIIDTQEPTLGANLLAKRIISHYQLTGITVNVKFSENLKTPGHVELSSSYIFSIEIQSQYQYSHEIVAAILAHEVAHIFLNRKGINFPDEFEEEVLADTTATYLGLGTTILNAASRSKSWYDNNFQTKINHFGYLSLKEIGYILAKRDIAFGQDSIQMLISELARSSLYGGRIRLQNDLSQHPFVVPPRHKRIFHPLFGGIYSKRVEKIMFDCPCCSQRLRLSETYRKISVRCPTCDSRFFCYF